MQKQTPNESRELILAALLVTWLILIVAPAVPEFALVYREVRSHSLVNHQP